VESNDGRVPGNGVRSGPQGLRNAGGPLPKWTGRSGRRLPRTDWIEGGRGGGGGTSRLAGINSGGGGERWHDDDDDTSEDDEEVDFEDDDDDDDDKEGGFRTNFTPWPFGGQRNAELAELANGDLRLAAEAVREPTTTVDQRMSGTGSETGRGKAEMSAAVSEPNKPDGQPGDTGDTRVSKGGKETKGGPVERTPAEYLKTGPNKCGDREAETEARSDGALRGKSCHERREYGRAVANQTTGCNRLQWEYYTDGEHREQKENGRKKEQGSKKRGETGRGG
jgi:hypothetical protein